MKRGVAAIAVVGTLLFTTFALCQEKEKDKEKKLKYMGAETCKNCHRAKTSGEQYNKWKEFKMAKSYETLATDKAKEIGKKVGVDDPQKSDKCLKCHTTAFGVDEKLLDKKFDKKQGVQCESCHGPAEQHVKNRMADAGEADEATQHANAQKEMPLPDKKVCQNCHNQEAFDITGEGKLWDNEKKEFKFEEAMKEIDHSNPKYKKDKEEKK